MSVNKYQPHVFILPEDDANRQMANGFWLDLSTRQIQVLTEAAGWIKACRRFASHHAVEMQRYEGRHLVLLVDFDGDVNRFQNVQAMIPDDLTDRVFVLGVWSEPGALKREGRGTYETIGKTMAQECRSRTDEIWKHDLLQHNESELRRLRQAVCGFLLSTLAGERAPLATLPIPHNSR
jgi:hypothetical protein